MSPAFLLSTTMLAVALIATPSVAPSRPVLLWNASPSAPIGLYFVAAPDQLHIGDLVAITPPRALADFLSRRGYLPVGVPLLKHVAATQGQQVCRLGRQVTIDDRPAVLALDTDHLGRPLPKWEGCHRLRPGEIFALNVTVPDSLDGRYFGVLPTTSMIGRARPIWLLREPSGPPR